MQEKYLTEIAERFRVPLAQIPLLPKEIKGLEMLAELGEQIYQREHGCRDNNGRIARSLWVFNTGDSL